MHWQELHFDIFLYITLRCRYWLYQTIDYIYYMFDYIYRKKYTYPCFAHFFFIYKVSLYQSFKSVVPLTNYIHQLPEII